MTAIASVLLLVFAAFFACSVIALSGRKLLTAIPVLQHAANTCPLEREARWTLFGELGNVVSLKGLRQASRKSGAEPGLVWGLPQREAA